MIKRTTSEDWDQLIVIALYVPIIDKDILTNQPAPPDTGGVSPNPGKFRHRSDTLPNRLIEY